MPAGVGEGSGWATARAEAGPGWGEGTGDAEAADPGAELEDVAEPVRADGPEAADGGWPAGVVADDADRAEYAELAE